MFPSPYDTPEEIEISIPTERQKLLMSRKDAYYKEAKAYFENYYKRIQDVKQLISENCMDPAIDGILKKMETNQKLLSEKKNSITSEHQKELRQEASSTLRVLEKIQDNTIKEISKMNMASDPKREKENEKEYEAAIEMCNMKRRILENEIKTYKELKRQYLELKKKQNQNKTELL